MRLPTLLLALCLAAAPARARAATTVDMVEHLLGASNTNAVAGHGALTAGFSADGDLTVLAWPGPSFADQLAYVASNALDARAQPHLGVPDGMGSYLGLVVATGSGTSLTWLRDAPWVRSQAYSKPDAPVPVTTFSRPDLGLKVTLTDVVSPDADVLTRHVRIDRAAGSTVVAVELALYENLSPTLSRVPEVPVADWAFDGRNDFLAVYDAAAGAIVHFHPANAGVMTTVGDLFSSPTSVDYGPVDALMKSSAPADADVDAFVASLDQAYGPGVAALVTTDPPPSSFQVGSDATSICGQVDALVAHAAALPSEFPGQPLPADPSSLAAFQCTDDLPALRAARGWIWAPDDALADLAVGALEGSRVAAGQTNGALLAPLVFEGDVAEGSALFAFGPTLAGARQALAAVAAQPFAARQAAAESAAHDALAKAALPSTALGARVRAVAQRALVNVYVARDRKVGAIVASISRQPPYYLDWPRDGAFISAALDVAGLGPWVTTRQEWYAGLQRTAPTAGSPLLTPSVPVDPDTGKKEFPAFAWEMNYFASGDPGGAIRFEIDNTALHVWAIVTHAATLSGADRDAFLAAVWPSASKALDLLARWRDAKTGLPAPANEDDHTALTSTLHGAVTVYAALRSGARLAHATGKDDDAKRWLDRAGELERAMLASYYDVSSGLFRLAQGAAPIAGAPETGWAAWPARVLEPGDPRLEAVLDADMDAVLKVLHGETEGGSYVGKNVVAAALYGKDGGSRDKARQAVSLLADVATTDTLQFGEVWVAEHGPGGGVTFSNRVAPPHVWEGVLFYLSAMALTDTSGFDPDVKQFPLPCFQDCTAQVEAQGCGCRAAGERGGPAAPLALLGLAAAATIFRERGRGGPRVS